MECSLDEHYGRQNECRLTWNRPGKTKPPNWQRKLPLRRSKHTNLVYRFLSDAQWEQFTFIDPIAGTVMYGTASVSRNLNCISQHRRFVVNIVALYEYQSVAGGSPFSEEQIILHI